MAELQDTDKFLVNRSGNSYQLTTDKLMAELQDTDLMLVNRGGISYKATGADIKDSLGPKGLPNKPSIVAPADSAGMEISAESDEITGFTTSVLTLSGSKDLSGDPSFVAGDAIEQDSGHTPTTSAITVVTEPDLADKVYISQSPDNILGNRPNFFSILDKGDTTTEWEFLGNHSAVKTSNATGNRDGVGFWYSEDGVSWIRSSSLRFNELQNTYLRGDPQFRYKAFSSAQFDSNIPADNEITGYITFSNPENFTFVKLSPDGNIIDETTLTFTDDTDLANFRVGDEVQTGVKVKAINEATPSIAVVGGTWTPGDVVTGPATTPATGTVASVNAAANTITLATSDEASLKRWIVNQGKFVKGPLSPSKDAAPNASGLALFSSVFTSTPTEALGQTGASWQVTAYDDINFASPIAQEIDSTTDLTQWQVVPELAANTKYRCRVRHISLDENSEWSDASTFKTNV